MSCHVEVNDPSSVVRKEDQNVEQLEGDGRHNEEVDRDDVRGVVLQERFPALPGGSLRSLGHVPLHGGFRDVESQFQYLAMKARSSPERIFVCHLFDQVDLGVWDLWPARY